MTIMELKQMLDKYNDDDVIWCSGVDSGGYDAEDHPDIRVVEHEHDGVTHLTLEGYE